MSFLDNLESSLEALESNTERGNTSLEKDVAMREAERKAQLSAAPHASALKSSSFTEEFLTACRVVGHQARVFVQFTWLDSTLRLDARNKRLELVPTPVGIQAVFYLDGAETASEPLSLESDPQALAERWLIGDQ